MLDYGDMDICLELYYCKDILYPHIGKSIIEAIITSFPNEKWKFTTDDGFWDDKDIDDYASDDALLELIPEPRKIDIPEYLKLEWTRKDTGIHVEYLCTQTDSLEVDIQFPALGGTHLVNPAVAPNRFFPGSLSIRCSEKVEPETKVQDLVEASIRLVPHLEPSYGFIKYRKETKMWSVDKCLMGIYWMTYFGPDFVEIIGEEKFKDLPCHEIKKLSDGSIILILTPTIEESIQRHGKKLRRGVKKQLGWKWFLPPILNKRWYPRLRNLVVEPEFDAINKRKQKLWGNRKI